MKLLDGRAHGDKRGAERARRTFPGSREERMPGPPRRKRGAEGSSRVVTGSSPGSRNPRFGCTPKKRLKAGTVLVREYQDERHTVTVAPDGFPWRDDHCAGDYRAPPGAARATMKPSERKVFRCAIYTRKSTEHNLDLEFNSLDAGQIP
jgi:hypothetical protein